MSSDSLSLSIPTILPPLSTSSEPTTPPPSSDSATSASSPPPTTQSEPETSPTSAPPPTSPTSEPPTNTNTNTDTNTGTGTGTGNGSGTPTGSGSGSESAPPSTTEQSTESTLTTPQATVTQVTVITTAPDGQTQTTVFETSTTLPPGSVVTSPASSSDSNTGAIAGGVVGGVAGLAILVALAVWAYKRWRLRKAIEEFDGNFDPDRVVSSGGAVGGMSQRPGGGGVLSRRDPPGAPTLPQIPIDDTEDDGMGGRLNAASVGGGVVSPYPLFAPGHGHGHSPHPSQTTFPNPYGPPPQSPTTTDSHYTGAMAGAGVIGGIRPLDLVYLLPHPAWCLRRIPAVWVQEREAYGGFAGGMPVPQHHPNQPAPYGPSSYTYYNNGNGSPNGRRMSASTSAPSDAQSQSQSNYSQPSGSASAQQHQQRLAVANPDEEFGEQHRTYLAEGPLVHRDAGPARDEIPPTYESILPGLSGGASRDVKGGGAGVGSGGNGEGGSGSRD
ncbi:hypothetical protein VNI00_018384 [Paramarasmius palmivorus]|uniref:Uncharacterized protein n=1 Tax=Paramarasmius palmivorus TaxID=297713 RepID=A0AAW0AY67_9AGAR